MRTMLTWVGVLAGSVAIGMGMYGLVVAPATDGLEVLGISAAPDETRQQSVVRTSSGKSQQRGAATQAPAEQKVGGYEADDDSGYRADDNESEGGEAYEAEDDYGAASNESSGVRSQSSTQGYGQEYGSGSDDATNADYSESVGDSEEEYGEGEDSDEEHGEGDDD